MGKRAAELKAGRKKKTSQQKMTKSQRVEAFIMAQQGSFTKADIQREFPDISMSTIAKVLRDLRKAGDVEMTESNYSK